MMIDEPYQLWCERPDCGSGTVASKNPDFVLNQMKMHLGDRHGPGRQGPNSGHSSGHKDRDAFILATKMK